MECFELFITFNIIISSLYSRGASVSHDPAIHLYLREGSRVKFGRGDDPNDVPIIECTNSRDKVELNCTLSVRSENRNCKVVLPADDDMDFVKVDSLYEFPDNKVIVVWQQSRSDVNLFARKITMIDIVNNCTSMATLTFPRYSENRRDLQMIVLYEDSFDVIAADHGEGHRTCVRYDLRGNEIETSSVPPGSIQNCHGDKRVKDVMTFFNGALEDQRATCTQSSKFKTICGQQSGNDSRSFFCVQMDVNQKTYRQQFRLPDNTLIIGVRNFNEGGMMLFGLESQSKLIVAEIRLARRPKILSVKLKWPVNRSESAVVDFREKRNDLHFTLIGETKEFNHSVVVQFFRLFDKSAKHHRRRS